MFHLFKQISPLLVVLLPQHKAAVRLYPEDACRETARGVAPGVKPRAAVERGAVECVDVGVTPSIYHAEIAAEAVFKTAKHLVAVGLAPYNAAQRDGIWRAAGELALVYIDANAKYAAANKALGNGAFGERSAYFHVAPVHVVGPFHGEAVGVMRQGVAHGQCPSLEHDELPPGLKPPGVHLDTEKQVLPRRAFPCVAPLPAPRRLVIGGDKGHQRAFRPRVFAEVAVGRVGLGEPQRYDVFHCFSIALA